MHGGWSLLRFLPAKSDPTMGHHWRSHQLANGIKNYLELGIIFLLQLVKTFGQFLIGTNHFSQAHEGPHDFNVDLHSAFAPQDAGQHGNAMLSESIGSSTTEATHT